MLPKNRRLTKKQVENVLQPRSRARRVSSKYFFASFLPVSFGPTSLSPNSFKPPTLRFAVVASKKIASLAVERNKIRRRVYSGLEGLWRTLKKPARSVDGVIMVKSEIKKASSYELVHDLERLLRAGGLVD